MKARQLASSPSSLYAVGSSGHVVLIERGPDGLWGWWRATGISAKHIAHGGGVIAVVGEDDRLSALQRYPDISRFTWDRTAAEVCATYLPGRGPVLFAADGREVVHTWKETPSSPWHEWESLDGPLASIGATAIAGGGLALFGIRDGEVWHRWQDRPFSAWREWTGLGSPAGGATQPCVGTITDGGLVVFAIGGDQAVHHRWQEKPFAPWQAWESLGGAVKELAVTKAPAGGLAVVAIGLDDQVSCRYQRRAFGEWSAWVDLGMRARSVTAQASYTDGLEVFAIGLDDEIRHTWCEALDAPWKVWTLLEYESSPLRGAASAPPGGSYGSSTSRT